MSTYFLRCLCTPTLVLIRAMWNSVHHTLQLHCTPSYGQWLYCSQMVLHWAKLLIWPLPSCPFVSPFQKFKTYVKCVHASMLMSLNIYHLFSSAGSQLQTSACNGHSAELNWSGWLCLVRVIVYQQKVTESRWKQQWVACTQALFWLGNETWQMHYVLARTGWQDHIE